MLGPLLFLIYINSIKEIGLKGYVTLYADYTSLFYYGLSINDVISDAKKDLKLLDTWFRSNILTINTLKTNYIIFTAKNKRISNYDPQQIENQPILKKESEKYLGLVLDGYVSFKNHINKIFFLKKNISYRVTAKYSQMSST